MNKRFSSILGFVVTLGVCLSWATAAFALPEGRAYEMVSPPYKGGYAASRIVVAPSGERVAYFSLGDFAGAGMNDIGGSYIAQRNGSGWDTTAVVLPATIAGIGNPFDFSLSLSSTLAVGVLDPNKGAGSHEAFESEFFVHDNSTPDTSANWEVFGGQVLAAIPGGTFEEKSFIPSEEGASTDLCKILVGGVNRPILSEAEGTKVQVYELSRGCDDGEPYLRLLGLDNQGKVLSPECVVLGGPSSTVGAVSGDGSEVFFSAPVSGGCGTHMQVFVRLGGERTLEVSGPLAEEGASGCSEVPCAGASGRASSVFQGASRDGSRVFFTTTDQLAKSDTDEGEDLYMASIGCPVGISECAASERVVTGLVQVSHAPLAGEAAEVQGVVKIAPDGSRVYFVARGVLSEDANAQGESPVKGADNLYVYDAETQFTSFVGDLCSGARSSGAVVDAYCPNQLKQSDSVNDTGLWLDEGEAQTGDNAGRFFVFSTYAQLIAHGPEADLDNAKDVYRYDAQTGALERVSVGESGADANGNAQDEIAGPESANATILPGHVRGGNAEVSEEYELGTRAASEDGSRIVFFSAEPLSTQATNGFVNAYEWHDGKVALVSSGSDEEGISEAVLTPSGDDLFFGTVQGLVPQDGDGVGDIYDARLGGVSTPVAAERERCAGDACQGALSSPAPLLVPGSVSQAPGENLTSPVTLAPKKKATKKKKKAKKKKKVVGRVKKVKRRVRGRAGRVVRGGSARRGRGQ